MIGGAFMSGIKGMKHFGKTILDEVKKMRDAGKTYREIAEYFNLRSSESVRELLKRDRRKEAKLEAGIIQRRRGRPPKEYVSTEADKDQEIKRLKMENELLRDFLRIAGRK